MSDHNPLSAAEFRKLMDAVLNAAQDVILESDTADNVRYLRNEDELQDALDAYRDAIAKSPLMKEEILLASLKRDLETAAGDYPVELPEPGTPTAILLSANVLLKRKNAALEAEVTRLKDDISGMQCDTEFLKELAVKLQSESDEMVRVCALAARAVEYVVIARDEFETRRHNATHSGAKLWLEDYAALRPAPATEGSI